MLMSTQLRKLTLTFHVAASVGWLGALAAFFAHALVGAVSHDELMVRAAAFAMG
jgi:hypothetical protein